LRKKKGDKRQPKGRGRKNAGEGNVVMWRDRKEWGNRTIMQT